MSRIRLLSWIPAIVGILRDYTRGPLYYCIKGWRHSPLTQEIAFIEWSLMFLIVRAFIFIIYIIISLYNMAYIPNVLSILVFSCVILDFYLLYYFILTRKERKINTKYKWFLYLCFLFFLSILILRMSLYIYAHFTQFGWNVLYTDGGYNTRLTELAARLTQAKRMVLEWRELHNISNQTVTLHDVGWRERCFAANSPVNFGRYEDVTYLFERFIDRNSHLRAFSQYYNIASWRAVVRRSVASVIIDSELLNSLAYCRDTSIVIP